MSELFKQAYAISQKLTVTEDDWREIVRLRLEAGESKSGMELIEIADCYNWSGGIILEYYEDKSPDNYKEALRVLAMLESMQDLPDWYAKYDIQLLARMAPMAYGFDPTQLEVEDTDAVNELVKKIVATKGDLETANGLPFLLQKSIFNPYDTGRTKSLSENLTAIGAIDTMISLVKDEFPVIPMGEVGFTCRGLLFHYCMPKSRTSFTTAKQCYKAAIRKLSLVEFGGSCAYTHLIDLLERPAVHGFESCVDETVTSVEALELREQREDWYRTDPSRRLMLWEIQMLLNHHWSVCSFGIVTPGPEVLQRALYLGEVVLAESDSNLIKQLTSALLGWIYQHRLIKTAGNLQMSLKYYRIALETNPAADGSISTDFTFVNMLESDRIRANTYRSETTLRKVLQYVLPMCFFPEKNSLHALPLADLDEFKQFLASHRAAKPDDLASALISKCYPEYEAFVARMHVMMSKSKPVLREDSFIMRKAEEVGCTIVEQAGNTNAVDKIKSKEDEFRNTADIVETFYSDVAMAQFYLGYSRTFSEIYVSSMAISAGTLATDAGSLEVGAVSMLLSMVPLIGNATSKLLEKGCEQYSSIKLKSSAEMMVTTFPQDSLMSDVVLQALRSVHTERLQELRDLELHSEKIMVGLLAKLTGKLESLKSLVAKQRTKSDLEKLAAQVAMEVIEHIYAGDLPRYASPAQTVRLLTLTTLKSVTDVHAEHQERSRPKIAALPAENATDRTPETASSGAEFQDPLLDPFQPTSDRPCIEQYCVIS